MRGVPCRRTSTLSALLFPTGNARVRQVGNRQQPAVASLLDGVELDAELLDLLRPLTAGLLDLRVSRPCRLARATSSPAAFCSRFSPSTSGSRSAAARFERGQLPRARSTGRTPRFCSADANGLEIVTQKCWIEHVADSTCDTMSGMERTVRKAVFPPRVSALASSPPRRRSRRKCWSSSTSRSFNTASRRPLQSGIDNIVIVTGRGKSAIEDHFDVAFELESFLERRGKKEQLDEIRKISQRDQRGLRAAGRAARARPRRAGRQESRRRRALRRRARRRCDRCATAGAAADDRRVRARGRAGDRRRARAAGGRLELRHRGDR